MTLGLLFWMLVILTFIFGLFTNWPGSPATPYRPVINTFLVFVLVVLLGWQVFGPALHR